jgi:hypothetical protein
MERRRSHISDPIHIGAERNQGIDHVEVVSPSGNVEECVLAIDQFVRVIEFSEHEQDFTFVFRPYVIHGLHD